VWYTIRSDDPNSLDQFGIVVNLVISIKYFSDKITVLLIINKIASLQSVIPKIPLERNIVPKFQGSILDLKRRSKRIRRSRLHRETSLTI
jgi:hypothetical protein